MMRRLLATACLLVCAAAVATPVVSRYFVDTNAVIDKNTGLMWQRDHASSGMGWVQALQYCEGLTTDGYTDWRLPNMKELLTLVDESAASPAIDADAFPGTPASWFWSSSAYPYWAFYAYDVDFAAGDLSAYTHTTVNYVRCVRSR